jgi:transposase-like protein
MTVISPRAWRSCVRWYPRYALSYRDLEEMMNERGLSVDHTTADSASMKHYMGW